MKKIAFIFALALSFLSTDLLTAQTRNVGYEVSTQEGALFVSTNYRFDAQWDDIDEDWYVLTEKADATLFIFNEDMTMFKHRTNTMSSDYYILSSEYQSDLDQYTLEVMSDVGNDYTMILDMADENLRFLYDRGGKTFMVQHDIKSTWKK